MRTVAISVLAAALLIGLGDAPRADGAARADPSVLAHDCPESACPLDPSGCHRDERDRLHCH